MEQPIVRQTTTVDWPLDIAIKGGNALVPFTQTFQVEGMVGSITCATDAATDSIKVSFDSPTTAVLDLRVFNQLDSSAPIVSLHRDVVEL